MSFWDAEITIILFYLQKNSQSFQSHPAARRRSGGSAFSGLGVIYTHSSFICYGMIFSP